MRILLIEDNLDLAASISEFLEANGHFLDFAYDGSSGLELGGNDVFDAIVLDIGLPGMNGLEVCKQLREKHQSGVPILMLTARDTLDDKLLGFEAGSDDYLVKPFSMRELEARLLALHKRNKRQEQVRRLRVADLEYCLDTEEVTRAGQRLEMKPSARQLLAVLMRNSHRVVTRRELELSLWGEDVPDADVLRVHMHGLRLAVDAPFDQSLLQTFRGIGYRLRDPSAE